MSLIDTGKIYWKSGLKCNKVYLHTRPGRKKNTELFHAVGFGGELPPMGCQGMDLILWMLSGLWQSVAFAEQKAVESWNMIKHASLFCHCVLYWSVKSPFFSCSHGVHCPLKVNLTLLKPAPRPKMYWIWWVSYISYSISYIKLHVPYIQHDVLMRGSLFAQPHCGFFQPSAAWTHLGGDSWSHHDGNLLDFELLEVRIDAKSRTKHWKFIKNHFKNSIKKSDCLFFEAWCLLKTLVFQLSPQPLQSEVLMIFWAESPLTDHLDMCLLDSSCGFQKHLPTT